MSKQSFIVHYDKNKNLIIEISNEETLLQHFGFTKEQTDKFIKFIKNKSPNTTLDLYDFFNI